MFFYKFFYFSICRKKRNPCDPFIENLNHIIRYRGKKYENKYPWKVYTISYLKPILREKIIKYSEKYEEYQNLQSELSSYGNRLIFQLIGAKRDRDYSWKYSREKCRNNKYHSLFFWVFKSNYSNSYPYYSHPCLLVKL